MSYCPDCVAQGIECPCSICSPPGQDEPRCPLCGYTEADARVHMDHQFCEAKGGMPLSRNSAPAEGDKP